MGDPSENCLEITTFAVWKNQLYLHNSDFPTSQFFLSQHLGMSVVDLKRKSPDSKCLTYFLTKQTPLICSFSYRVFIFQAKLCSSLLWFVCRLSENGFQNIPQEVTSPVEVNSNSRVRTNSAKYVYPPG